MPSLYLINPRPQAIDYDTAPGFAAMPDLATLTVAAMAPDHWVVSVCEEATTAVDLNTSAHFVGLTGKNAQLPRMIELSAAFRERGKVVLIGGPLASLDPAALRPHADILVTGEIEDIAPQFFADLESGDWKDAYDGGRADIRKSPTPRWDLYPVDKALMGALQTTRGCPFECEFCDVIQYNGRKQRHKDIGQVIAELDALYATGFRYIFLTDDNFTVHRQFARDMLDAIAGWNAGRVDDPVRFATQASIDIAREPDMLQRCVAAGLTHLFIGIETVNVDSLRETRKRQNLLMAPLEAVERIVSYGILVRNGVMVGFDHDGPEIFDTLFNFLQSAPLPTPTIGALTASPGTPLYARLKQEGRLLDGDRRWVDVLSSNFVPKKMSYEELISGTTAFARRAFTPAAFEQRMMNFINIFGTALPLEKARPSKSRAHSVSRASYAMSCVRKVSDRGRDEAAMVSRVFAAAAGKPSSLRHVINCLVFYEQYRAYFDRSMNGAELAA